MGILETYNKHKKAKIGMTDFLALPKEFHAITFYAEDDHSFAHFKDIIAELNGVHQQPVSYLTSQIDDPILKTENPLIKSFFIGEGMVRTSLFFQLKSKILFMTMPDLETFHLKRSKTYPVHYIYAFHAMVSTHSNYRRGAFDHYDTIFCTGPYQLDEIRATEKHYGLPAKKLVQVGYPHLETLIQRHKDDLHDTKAELKDTILLAPTWGENSIFEICGEDVIKAVLETGYKLIVRPHPMTTKHRPDIIARLRDKFSQDRNFSLETDISDKTSVLTSKILITDWSGISFEYAFANQRPVVFIDVPKKCFNDGAAEIGLEPIEVSIRSEIGKVVNPDNIESIKGVVEDMMTNPDKHVDKVQATRAATVFNLGSSVSISCQSIMETLKNL